MSKKIIYILIATLLLLHGNSTNAQGVQNRLDSLFNAVNGDPQMHFNGSVLVAEKGKIIYANSKGYADFNKKILNNAQTNYSLASLSKVFTAIAVMQLKEKGKIKLDDALIKYLPGFPYPEITIKQILSHTSGLPDFNIFQSYKIETSNSCLTNNDIIPALKNGMQLIAKPGAQWHYSNIGFGLLALLVEAVSHQTFQQYVQENICKPAGMKNTYISTPCNYIIDSTRAVSYVNPQQSSADITASDSLRTNLSDPIQSIVGPGLVVSSVDDLMKFDAALYEDKLLQAGTKEEMFTPVKLSNGEFAQIEHAPLYNALGWGVDIDSSAGKIVSHTGGSPGISTILLRNISKKQLVIVLENTDNPAPLTFGINAMNILNDKPLMHFRPR